MPLSMCIDESCSIKQSSLIKQVDLWLRFGLGQAEVFVGEVGGLASSRGPDDQVATEEIRLDLVLDGIDVDAHRRGEGFGAGGSALEDLDQGFEVAAVLAVHAVDVDVLHGQRGVGDC